MNNLYKNLALNLVRVTESAAIAAGKFLGKGLKEEGDKAAVDAMRNAFSTIDINGAIWLSISLKWPNELLTIWYFIR